MHVSPLLSHLQGQMASPRSGANASACGPDPCSSCLLCLDLQGVSVLGHIFFSCSHILMTLEVVSKIHS